MSVRAGRQVGQPARPSARSVPASMIGSAASSWTARMSPVVAHAALSSSIARQMVRRSAPSPPYSTGYGSAEDVLGGEEVLEVPRELGRPVDLGGPGRDPLTGDLADGVAELALLVGEAVRGRLGCRGHVAAS